MQDYKLNHVEFSDSLKLPLPEMVDMFSDILRLVGVKLTTMKLQASCSPDPCIHLSGPRCQVDVLVAPMLKTSLTSTSEGKCMLSKAGQQLKSNFNTARRKCKLTPGDVLQALRCGLERVLALCEQQDWGSVAIPIIGPGFALSVPDKAATNILTEVIAVFQSLSSETDEITIALGRCQLYLVFGDISNESTDAIVNITNFIDLQRGKGGLDARVVAESILQGMKEVTVDTNLKHLKTIHIVLLKIHVFLEFKTVAQQIFGMFTQMTVPAPLAPLITATRGHQPPCLSLDLSALVQSLPVQQTMAEFVIVGLSANNISEACEGLHQAYESQCSSQSFSTDELNHLTAVEWLKKGVNEIIRLIQGSLVRQVREKEQDSVFSSVSWCILGLRGDWERMPKEAHHQLESQNVRRGVTDAQGRRWLVNLTKMQATLVGSRQVAKLKRLVNLPDFSFPMYWDSMDPGDSVNLVLLQLSSAEYRRVKQGFKNTVQKAMLKIKCVQNVRLCQAYEVHKKQLQDKNGPTVGAGERTLYHRTKDTACSSIQNTNFNHNFSGQNGKRCG
ncbi:hypothetical protein P4O66_008646 [Electrophorus voltai]|uniref:PARP catalytic domain-containing protein n=1 Tax=Electrophorus voltai TaxID=2609070 RepID=A0AAD9DZT5_9TELE|nr:hypothetical protein P4O66_008646 [Electrophorus voltai]